jgi:hypothetical protein
MSEEIQVVFGAILQLCTWIENICDDFTESHGNSTLKPEYAALFKEAVKSACEEADWALLEEDVGSLIKIALYLSGLHDDALNRVQPRVLCSIVEFERYCNEHAEESEKYGFYKNGCGRIEER